ncbi:8160_t:CDS:2 [Acaulospora morrowiae]|uniref:8160_t:CDS:1 n=1 Tax=Acaulospora morrowiae TaxID=94023 RepID=A0A9N9BKZ8_9GLOM|nr:8160_t:CDS:2 [Acaulospora morrowiae]
MTEDIIMTRHLNGTATNANITTETTMEKRKEPIEELIPAEPTDEVHHDQGSDGKKKEKTRMMITLKIKHRDVAIIVIMITRSPQRSSIIIDSKRTSQKVYPLLMFLDRHQGSGTSSIIEEEDGGFPNSVTPKASDLMLESLRLYKSEDEFDSIDLGEPTCNGMTALM